MARPASLLLVLVAGLAGCAGRLLPCNGLAQSVPVKIETIHADRALSKEIRDSLQVNAACVRAHHDPETEQSRWSYWVELKGTQPEESQGRHEIKFHLTQLVRKVTNHLDLSLRELQPAITLQEFNLDAIRADLHVPGGSGLTFPCAEMLGPARANRVRSRSGLYRVERLYTGDVTVKEVGSANIRFVPVTVAFEVDFLLEKSEPLASAEARENARRQLEWARVTNTCETCRPLIMCESLGRPIGSPPDPFRSLVHMVGVLEKRPVVVDDVLAQRKRTMVCTRWTPAAGPQADGFVLSSDSSDQGLSPQTPYLTFHHVAQVTGNPPPTTWRVEVLLAEIVDPWEDLAPGSASAARRKAREEQALAACQQEKAVFEQTITVPAHLTAPAGRH